MITHAKVFFKFEWKVHLCDNKFRFSTKIKFQNVKYMMTCTIESIYTQYLHNYRAQKYLNKKDITTSRKMK
uniref:Uncharacterized protein n=1 Tax=Solanum lycopersicum TaxID=4081 RepID=A0A3Q7HT48_SOLLC